VQPTLTLRGGIEMPVLGLGVWQMAAGRETEQAVEWALEAGYRHVDTATLYRNEQSVGAALRRSGVRREEVFVTTKLLPQRGSAAGELQKSLGRLGLDYVDLYLIHWPIPALARRAWRQLVALHEQGLARTIGVSNYGRSRLSHMIDGPSPPAVNQVQFNPFRYRRALLEYCLGHGIVFEAYSPLARGRGIANPTILEIARRLDRTPAQVMLRWAIQHRAIVIPKSTREERIRENARVFDFELSADDLRRLDALDRTRQSARAYLP
jgi:diketogulonate reductase-like aldo/keto reductase